MQASLFITQKGQISKYLYKRYNAISFPAHRAGFSCVGVGTAFGRTFCRTQYIRRPRSSPGARSVRAAEHLPGSSSPCRTQRT
jgi:hypothetical protein